jgi:hypothetical protein
MGKFSQQWTDLLTIESHVVIDDAEFATVISSS